jgi:transposase
VIGLDEKGAIVLREKVSRTRIAARFVNVPPCLIGIEASMASHHVARELVALGHEVKQVPPAYSKPFRQAHKNDFRDAHAVAEAVERPSTRCVPIKTDEQLDLQALHRVRSRLISNRTAVINQSRGFLLEHGIPVRQGHHFLRQQLPQLLATRTDVLSPRMIRIIEDLMADWKYLDERIERVTDEIEVLARADESCQQLIAVPGIGPIISSAMVAAIGNGAAYRKGRDFAAWLGLVPKQMSTVQSSPDRHIRLAPHGRSIQSTWCAGVGPPSQSWRTFLRNHADDIAAMDLFVVPTIAFRLLYGLLIMGHGRRQILWLGVTAHPTAEWIANQLTAACGWEELTRYLIRDRNACYGGIFVRRVRSLGIRDHPTSARSPWQNGYAERLIGSIRRECLDHIIVVGEQHVRHILMCYLEYYNARPNASLIRQRREW